MALRLHAVTASDHPLASGTGLRDVASAVAVRELAAVITRQPEFVATGSSPDAVEQHTGIVDRLFHAGAVLPAPVGVVFRSDDVLSRWIDLHYVALSDALTFVEDRVAMRVHICRDSGCDPKAEIGTDVAAAAADAFRGLRRKAVAAVPLRAEHFTGIVVSSAYLVDRDLIKDFESTVTQLRHANTSLVLRVSGPWPPYDFVQMQFGG